MYRKRSELLFLQGANEKRVLKQTFVVTQQENRNKPLFLIYFHMTQ